MNNKIIILIIILSISILSCTSIESPRTQRYPSAYALNGYAEFSDLKADEARRKAIRMAKDDYDKKKYRLFAGDEVIPSEKYLKEKYNVYSVPIVGCLVDEGIIAAEDAYNKTMKDLLTKKFGKNIFAEAAKYEDEVYKRAPLTNDMRPLLTPLLVPYLVPDGIKNVSVELSPGDTLYYVKQGDVWEASRGTDDRVLFRYQANSDKILVGYETRKEIRINLNHLFDCKNKDQIKNLTEMEIISHLTGKEMKVKIEKNKNSIFLRSGEKIPIKIFWENK
jgi:mannose-6-phosphate isomerase class I